MSPEKISLTLPLLALPYPNISQEPTSKSNATRFLKSVKNTTRIKGIGAMQYLLGIRRRLRERLGDSSAKYLLLQACYHPAFVTAHSYNTVESKLVQLSCCT